METDIHDSRLQHLIKEALRAETSNGHAMGKRPINSVGIPEGLSISNLLANVFMQKIDEKYSSYTPCIYFRYVDDILILTTSEKSCSEIQNQITADIETLGLTLNTEKKSCGPISQGFEYLGYLIEGHQISVRKNARLNLEKSLERIFREYQKSKSKISII